MKKISLISTCIVLIMSACNSSKKTVNASANLNGEWELNYISGPRIAFQGLYPDQKPTINFDTEGHKVFGKNSCNVYNGTLHVKGSSISFVDSKMAVSLMACPGDGEAIYMKMLEKIDSYAIADNGKELSLSGNGVVLMRFIKK